LAEAKPIKGQRPLIRSFAPTRETAFVTFVALLKALPVDMRFSLYELSYSAKPILSQELSLFVVAGHIESSNAG